MPHPYHLNGTGSNSRSGPPYLFADAVSGPRNLLHHDTVSSTATPCHHRDDDCALLIGKLRIGSTLGHSLSIFVHPNVVTRPLPLHTIKGERGTLDQNDGRTTPHNGNVLSTHSSTQTHPHTETWEIFLSRPACIPLLQALRCKATQAAASTESRDV
jgi:hypothetical protein